MPQLVGVLTGIGAPLAQARNARPGLSGPARRQRHRPLGAADVAQPHPTKMRLRPLLRVPEVRRSTHARKLPTTTQKKRQPPGRRFSKVLGKDKTE
jgi:hypothetical protein